MTIDGLEKNVEQTVLTGRCENRHMDQQSNAQYPEYKAGVLHRLSSYSFWLELPFSSLTLHHDTIDCGGLPS